MVQCFRCRVHTGLRCAGCGIAHYCSAKCQKDSWPQHRITCKRWSIGPPKRQSEFVLDEPDSKRTGFDVQLRSLKGLWEATEEILQRLYPVLEYPALEMTPTMLYCDWGLPLDIDDLYLRLRRLLEAGTTTHSIDWPHIERAATDLNAVPIAELYELLSEIQIEAGRYEELLLNSPNIYPMPDKPAKNKIPRVLRISNSDPGSLSTLILDDISPTFLSVVLAGPKTHPYWEGHRDMRFTPFPPALWWLFTVIPDAPRGAPLDEHSFVTKNSDVLVVFYRSENCGLVQFASGTVVMFFTTTPEHFPRKIHSWWTHYGQRIDLAEEMELGPVVEEIARYDGHIQHSQRDYPMSMLKHFWTLLRPV